MGDIMQRIRHVFHLLSTPANRAPLGDWPARRRHDDPPALLAARGLGCVPIFPSSSPTTKRVSSKCDAWADGSRRPRRSPWSSTFRPAIPKRSRNSRRLWFRRIRALGPDWVGTVDAGNRDSHAFSDRVKLLYAPLADVRQVHDEVRQRYDYEVQKRAGGDLGLEDPPPPLRPRRCASGLVRLPRNSSRRGTAITWAKTARCWPS